MSTKINIHLPIDDEALAMATANLMREYKDPIAYQQAERLAAAAVFQYVETLRDKYNAGKLDLQHAATCVLVLK